MRKRLPQIYGTQFVKMGQNAKFERYKIDSTQITDEQRKYYHVETLAEQKIKEYKMNLTSIMQFYSQEKSLEKTLELIAAEKNKGTPPYMMSVMVQLTVLPTILLRHHKKY